MTKSLFTASTNRKTSAVCRVLQTVLKFPTFARFYWVLEYELHFCSIFDNNHLNILKSSNQTVVVAFRGLSTDNFWHRHIWHDAKSCPLRNLCGSARCSFNKLNMIKNWVWTYCLSHAKPGKIHFCDDRCDSCTHWNSTLKNGWELFCTILLQNNCAWL